MAIDFTLTPRQRTIQRQSREFARDIIARANSAELLPTAEERFLATKPIYQAMVAAGFLRKCIPVQAGGESAGLVELAILAEEFYSINASVSLTLIGTLLGLLPILLGGSAEQRGRLLAPFLKTSGAPLAAFCATEPGGSANAASPPPGEGVRTTAKLEGDRWIIQGRKSWISSASGWDRKGANVLCVVCRTGSGGPPERSVSIIAVEHPAAGFVFEDAVDLVFLFEGGEAVFEGFAQDMVGGDSRDRPSAGLARGAGAAVAGEEYLGGGLGLVQLLLELGEGAAQGLGLGGLVFELLRESGGELLMAEAAFEGGAGEVVLLLLDSQLGFAAPLLDGFLVLLEFAIEQVLVGDGDGDLGLDLEELILHVEDELFGEFIGVLGFLDEVVDVGS